MLNSTPDYARASECGGRLDEHPNSQQGYSGSLLASQDDRERIHGGGNKEERKRPQKGTGEITRVDGKGKGEKQGEEDERKDQGPAVSQPLKG